MYILYMYMHMPTCVPQKVKIYFVIFGAKSKIILIKFEYMFKRIKRKYKATTTDFYQKSEN